MKSENVFLLQRHERAASCYSILASMKEDDKLCDVTIHAGGLSFKAHRVILAAGIPYFRAMFCSNMVECTKKEIVLAYVDPFALEHLINFAYTHELKITTENVVALLKAAMYLQLDLVVDACFVFLYERIDCNTVLVIHSCAVLTNREDMIENANRYIRENFEDFSLTGEFVDLPLHMLKDIICRDDLFVVKEEIVFEAVMRWVKASEIDRSAHLPELLPYIRMPFLTEEYLNTHVCNEELIQALPECKDIVNEAKNYHKKKETSYSFQIKERFCKEKNHLKCAELKGCSLYVISKGRSSVLINYYDPISTKLYNLGDPLGIDAVHIRYVVCTEDSIYFLYDKCIQTLNLKTLQLKLLEHEHKLPAMCGILMHQHKLYFVGGVLGINNEVYSFGLEDASLVRKGCLLEKRLYPGTASMGECIYITGGFSGSSRLRSAEKYNSLTGQKSEIAEMLYKRFGHGCAAVNGKIYVCGGNSSGVTISGEVYDPVSNHWNQVSRMTTISGSMCLLSYASELCITDNRVWSEDGLLVRTYNPSEDKWQFGIPCSLPSKRCEFLCAVATESASPIIRVQISFRRWTEDGPTRRGRWGRKHRDHLMSMVWNYVTGIAKMSISWTDVYLQDSSSSDSSDGLTDNDFDLSNL